ncbi:MAG TPA: pyridoxal 5'-phosphate synthase, partial [Chryseolinea sp.]|nr:pyridoxal 5'-phosphate synthase [Chryseolinea sp.]
MRDYAGIRSEYLKAELDIRSVLPNPVDQFEIWFEEVLNAGVQEPNAMTLASVSNHGKPSLRIVLLKGIEEKKFIFYTNYNSKKGRELENNSACAVNFFWPALERQVRIEGNAEPVRHMVSDEYYNSRPRNAQIGAWASPQSESIA